MTDDIKEEVEPTHRVIFTKGRKDKYGNFIVGARSTRMVHVTASDHADAEREAMKKFASHKADGYEVTDVKTIKSYKEEVETVDESVGRKHQNFSDWKDSAKDLANNITRNGKVKFETTLVGSGEKKWHQTSSVIDHMTKGPHIYGVFNHDSKGSESGFGSHLTPGELRRNEQFAPSGESLDEGRGRPPKPGSAAYKRRQSEGGGDSDTPGLHGQLIKHKSLQNAPPKIKFTNGEEAHISAEHRDRAIKHLEGMIGPGKNPQARDNAVEAMSRSHSGLMQAIGVESKPEETKSSMSAQRDKPKLSLTKEESNMSQEDIVEKLQAALDAGILSQNDFDKLTQIDELSSNLLNRAKETTYAKLDKTDVNIYPTPNQLKKVQDLRKQGQKFKDAANAKTQSEEVEAVDEKTLSPKQKKIAAVAGHPDKIDAEDFKKLRKEETTAGVSAVVAALSRNLKELK